MKHINITYAQQKTLLGLVASEKLRTERLAEGLIYCAKMSARDGDEQKAKHFAQRGRSYFAEARMLSDLFDRLNSAVNVPEYRYTDDFASDGNCVEDDPFTSSSYVPF